MRLSHFCYHADIEGASRGAIAAEDLEVGDVALEIPLSIIISEELVQESDMASVIISMAYKNASLLSTLQSMQGFSVESQQRGSELVHKLIMFFPCVFKL